MNKKISLPEELQPSQEQLEAADELVEMLVLSQGTTVEGEAYWAYLAIPPSNLGPFGEAQEHGSFHLGEYGRLLKYGMGKEPPEDVKRHMEETYGMNHNFEEEVFAKAEEMVKEQRKKAATMDKYTTTKKPLSRRGEDGAQDQGDSEED